MSSLTVPQLSISMEEARVSRWLVADGEPVARGQVVVEVETDKATVEIESPADGVLRIVAVEGAIVPVEGVLAELEQGGGGGDKAVAPAPEPEPTRPHVEPARELLAPTGSTIAPVPVDEAVPGPRPSDLDNRALLGLYRDMVRVRVFEEEVIDAFAQGLIPGSTHPASAQRRSRPGCSRLSSPTTSSSPRTAVMGRRCSRASIPSA